MRLLFLVTLLLLSLASPAQVHQLRTTERFQDSTWVRDTTTIIVMDFDHKVIKLVDSLVYSYNWTLKKEVKNVDPVRAESTTRFVCVDGAGEPCEIHVTLLRKGMAADILLTLFYPGFAISYTARMLKG